MQFKITTKYISISAQTQASIVKNIEKLRRQFNDLTKNAILWIELARITRHHNQGAIYSVKLQLPIKRKASLRAEATQENLLNACEEAFKELMREMRKHRTKQIEFRRRVARRLKRKTRRG